MKTNDSLKVVSHIEDAKNWLDEAKTEYLQNNRVRGELNLNLAQAEVKYAWELSRNQSVINNKQSYEQSFSRKQFKYHIPAVAASVVVLLGLGIVGYFFQLNPNRTQIDISISKNQAQLGESKQPAIKEPVIAQVEASPSPSVNTVKLLKVAENSATRQDIKALPKTGEIVMSKSGNEIVKTEVAKTEKKIVAVNIPASDDKITRKSADSPKVPVSVSAPVIQETAEPAVAFRNNSVEKQRDSLEPPMKPAAITLIIDEEALTKEASFSLKNGK